MSSGINNHSPAVRFILLICLALALAIVSACTTETNRQTATAEARSTPVSTITPAGNIQMIGDETVIQVFVPDSQQPALYALTDQRLYVMHNREWQPTSTINNGRTFLVDHNNTERLFRGDHPSCGREEESDPMDFEVSEDGGETWRVISSGRNIRPLAIDPVFPNVLFGTDCSLTISTDLGETWRSFQPLSGHEIIDLVVVGERVLVLGISTQGKSQIRELRMTTPDDPQISDIILEVPGIASVDADQTRIVVGTLDGIRLSIDGGKTWSSSRVGLEGVTIHPEDMVTPDPSIHRQNPRFGILTVAIDTTHTNRVFAGTVRGLYISQDNGGTWDLYGNVDEHARVTDLQFALGSADVYVMTDAGVVAVPNP
jgi:hypothetical protein